MTKIEVVEKLKKQRAGFRRNVFNGVHEEIVTAARGGHFPNFDTISKRIMSTISEKMLENPEITIDEWIVMLQEKEPDKYCNRTMDIVEKECQEK